MRNRFLAIAAVIGIIAAGLAWFAAEESYVLNIQANVGTALEVNAHGAWDLQEVFPQERFSIQLEVKLSEHFLNATHVDGLQFHIGCQSKENGSGINLCPFIQFQDKSTSFPAGFLQCGIGEASCFDKVKLETAGTTSKTYAVTVIIPDCTDAHQLDADKIKVGCTQGNPISASADIFIERPPDQLVQGDVPCIDNKKDVAPIPPGCVAK